MPTPPRQSPLPIQQSKRVSCSRSRRSTRSGKAHIRPAHERGEALRSSAGEHQRPHDAVNVRSDLEAAQLPTAYGTEALTFKDVTRHSFASWLGAAGVPDEIIGRLMATRPARSRASTTCPTTSRRCSRPSSASPSTSRRVRSLRSRSPLRGGFGAPQDRCRSPSFPRARGRPGVPR
jgi:hypothetical protein